MPPVDALVWSPGDVRTDPTLQYREIVDAEEPRFRAVDAPAHYDLWGRVAASEGELVLREPLRLEIQHTGRECLLEVSRLNLFGHGASLEAAVRDLCEFLLHDYFAYTRSDDGELSRGGLALKQEYLRLVENAVHTA